MTTGSIKDRLPAPGGPLPHLVSTAPFNPQSAEDLTEAQRNLYLASQWRLMWWKFKRHRLAVASGAILIVLYAAIAIVEFLAPYNDQTINIDFIRAPPQSVHIFHEGRLTAPFVYGLSYKLNMDDLKREYTDDTSKRYPIRFFCRGDSYRFWGLIEGDLHLVCPAHDGTLFLLGTDRLGRDMLSRMIYGGRISLTIGLIGISISFVLGVIIGGLGGYYGGKFDMITQRAIEVIQSLPHIPLWLALSSIMPPNWSPLLISASRSSSD